MEPAPHSGRFRHGTMTETTNAGLRPRTVTDVAQFDKGDECLCAICRVHAAVGVDAETRLSVCRKCAELEEGQ